MRYDDDQPDLEEVDSLGDDGEVGDGDGV